MMQAHGSTPEAAGLARPKTLPDEADVIIVGAGIVGAACFYELAQAGRGLRVFCFDKSHKLHGSTARSAAAFRHQFSAAVNVESSLLSARELLSFPARFGTEPVFQQNGYCFAYTDQGAFEEARIRAERQRALGVPDLEVLEASEARARFPALAPSDPPLVGVTFCRHDGFVFPDRVTNVYFEAGERTGSGLRQYAPIVGVERAAGRVAGVVVEGGHVIRTSWVVNAAGPWSGFVAESFGCPIPLTPVKRYLYFTRPLQERGVQGFPMYVLDLGAYCRPEGKGLMLGWDLRPEKPAGWDRFPSQPRSPGDMDADRIEPGFGLEDYGLEVLSEVARGLPFLEEEGALQAVTSGFYEVSPDEKAIVSLDPRLEGLIHATGFSGHGVMHAPSAGKLVRALVLGEAPPVDAEALALAPLLENRPRKDPEAMVI